MKMKKHTFSKLTKAYLRKFFKDRDLPYEEWDFIIDGVSYRINNYYVIDSILKATPENQRMIADALCEYESSNKEVNKFLRNLALESHRQAK